MSKVFSAHAVSVDGYISGRTPDGEEEFGRGLGDAPMLFDWYMDGDTPSQVFNGFKLSEPSALFFDAIAARVGATVAGRTTYEHSSHWGGGGPHPTAPLFVLSHRPAPEIGDTQTLVTTGIDAPPSAGSHPGTRRDPPALRGRPVIPVTGGRGIIAAHAARALVDPGRTGKPPKGAHMLDPDVRRVLDGTSIAHIATALPDGAPHAVPIWVGTHGDRIVFLAGPGSRKAQNLRRDPRMALSIAPVDNPFTPVVIRGRAVEWLEGDAAWEIIDQLSTKYTGAPYPREQERVVVVIEPDRQTVGVG